MQTLDNGESMDGLPTEESDMDVLFHVLQASRRRLAITIIDEMEPIELSDLTEEITAIEFGTPFDSQERKRVYVSLYQTHMPELEQRGIVECIEQSVYKSGPRLPMYVGAMGAVAEEIVES